jgi:predicted transcriptional regulator
VSANPVSAGAENSPNLVAAKAASPRHALLDLAPLELDCMNTLWPMGEGTVREIRDGLAIRRPRAYTTIMTIMDRLARKGVVERRKVNRAYVYRPNLSAEQAREQALGQVVENSLAARVRRRSRSLALRLPLRLRLRSRVCWCQ